MHRFTGSQHASNPITGNLLHLPNGINVIVNPVFGGFYFKVHELNTHHGAFPPGWTVVIHAEDPNDSQDDDEPADSPYLSSKVHKYRTPTLRKDVLFISSISNPSNNDFRPAQSPSREIAMMLWATLWWYFHHPQPPPQLAGDADPTSPVQQPQLDWRVYIKREGIFNGRHLLSKLERMSLIACEDSSVGVEADDRRGTCIGPMFVSQRAFWQIDPRIFLFTLSPAANSPYPSSSPYPSRPSSPNRAGDRAPGTPGENGLTSPRQPPEEANPFYSSSHLPTYYPQAPTQYIRTKGIRHPLRPRPPRQGETFYTRYVPSTGQYLSFRCASMSAKQVVYKGPYGQSTPSFLPPNSALNLNAAVSSLSFSSGSDIELLHTWMNNPRVKAAWGCGGPKSVQEEFLRTCLASKHSFPAIGCWDGKPFGFFEIYWAKEDQIGRALKEGEIRNYDRGFHVLVGEEEFRGPQRVRVWLSALVHVCWLSDPRTESVVVEPKADNNKIITYFEGAGFVKQREVKMPHKTAAFMKISRETWQSPCL